MTHAINYSSHRHKLHSKTSLLTIDYITKTHTQMRKSSRGDKDSRKEMRTETEREKNKEVKKLEKN